MEGLRYVLGHPVLRNISMMMALVNFVSVTAGAQIVLFAKHQLQANDAQVSLLYSASSIGIVVLSLSAGLLRKRWSFSTVALGALMLEGALTAVFALMRWYWVAIALWTLIGGLGILFNIVTLPVLPRASSSLAKRRHHATSSTTPPASLTTGVASS